MPWPSLRVSYQSTVRSLVRSGDQKQRLGDVDERIAAEIAKCNLGEVDTHLVWNPRIRRGNACMHGEQKEYCIGHKGLGVQHKGRGLCMTCHKGWVMIAEGTFGREGCLRWYDGTRRYSESIVYDLGFS